MIFVSLGKMRSKPRKQMIGDSAKMMEQFEKKGIKILNWYWTLGRYDVVIVFEAADEKEALKFQFGAADFQATETLVAIQRQEAINLL